MKVALTFMVLGAVAPLAGLVTGGCGSRFEGCEASRTCGGSDSGGDPGEGDGAGKGGSGARGGSGGRVDAGGEGGESGERSATGGTGNSPASAGEGGDGTVTGETGGEGGRGTEPDTTAPTIVSVSPLEGQSGIRSDAPIVITFSEPMNRISVELAYQSKEIPLANAKKEWSENDTVLTLTPFAPLAYAEGDVDVEGLSYTIAVSDTATDLAGNRLESKEWFFRTLRRITQTLTAEGMDVRFVRAGVLNNACNPAMDATTVLGGSGAGYPEFLFVQFDLAPVLTGIREWEGAELKGTRVPTNDLSAPFGWGVVRVNEVDADIATGTLETPVGPDLGVFISDVNDEPNLDVLGVVVENNQDDRLLQLRIMFDGSEPSTPDAEHLGVRCAHHLELRYAAR